MEVFRATFRKFESAPKMSSFAIYSHRFPHFLFKLSKSLVGSQFHTKSSAPSYKSLLSHHLQNHRLDRAIMIFNQIPFPDPHLYTMMITGYAMNGRLYDALELFDRMPVRDVVTWNSTVNGCLECGDLAMAQRLFDEMPERNVVSWTTMVNGYLKFGRVDTAEVLFRDMPVRDVAAWNAMIYGYCAYKRVEEGMKLFEEMPRRNVISWTSMICGLDQNGKSEEALVLFQEMMVSGVKPTSSTFACVLTACANAVNFNLGVQVHGFFVKLGYCSDEFISASLLTFYANCKKLVNAQQVFDETLSRNVVICTALLTGFGLNCEHEGALRVFGDMMNMSVLPNQSTFTSALNSCCGLEALDKGKEMHTVAIKLGLQTDVFVGNSLVVMYNECGNINDAMTVFKEIDEKNVVSWNAIIVGSAQHGCGMWALILLNQMIRSGVEPDEITFTGILSACNHAGMLQKGRRFFEYISQYNSTELKVQHYVCMVDILGRSGKLYEAEELMRTPQIAPEDPQTRLETQPKESQVRFLKNLDPTPIRRRKPKV